MMKLIPIVIATTVLLVGAAAAQEHGAGTINTLTVNPTVNQELSGTMPTVSGQPNDVSAGSEHMPSGLVPVTTNMEGSGSNGNLDQPVAKTENAPAAASADRATAAPKQETKPGTPSRRVQK